MSDRNRWDVVIVGAGPAGLAAAFEVVRRGRRPLVLERSLQVGGIARTEVYRGYRFDVGGHRFYTKVEEIQALWEEMLGADFLVRGRLSRILYNHKLFNYPLSLPNTLRNLGVTESLRVLVSYLRARLRRRGRERSFEEWVSNRFGKRLYETFFAEYTEKVWGVPGSEIKAEWAVQRIRNLSLRRVVANALLGTNSADSLIARFHYPVLGPGMMWERFASRVEAGGGEVRLGAEVLALHHADGRVVSVEVGSGDDAETIPVHQVLSSMPITTLVRRLRPEPPAAVLEAAAGLSYRAMISVGLIVAREALFPDHWVYVHSPEVRVGRIQNYKNWSPQLVPDPTTTSVGMEYFCDEGDALWQLSDDDLVALARREIAQLDLAPADAVVDGMVIRQPKAYPVYDADQARNLAVLRAHLGGLANLQTVGRNGLHRYNNQDHSMVTGQLAVANLDGESHDLWSVNCEQAYSEER